MNEVRLCNITDKTLVVSLFESERFDIKINLAAQAVAKYGVINSETCVAGNVLGFRIYLGLVKNIM